MGADPRPRIIERGGFSVKTWTIMSKTSNLFKSVGDTIITGACKIEMRIIDRIVELVQRMIGWVG